MIHVQDINIPWHVRSHGKNTGIKSIIQDIFQPSSSSLLFIDTLILKLIMKFNPKSEESGIMWVDHLCLVGSVYGRHLNVTSHISSRWFPLVVANTSDKVTTPVQPPHTAGVTWAGDRLRPASDWEHLIVLPRLPGYWTSNRVWERTTHSWCQAEYKRIQNAPLSRPTTVS